MTEQSGASAASRVYRLREPGHLADRMGRDLLERRDAAARQAAGWDVCLGELDKHLAGQLTNGPHSTMAKAWQPLYEAYVAAGLPAGAPVPGLPATS